MVVNIQPQPRSAGQIAYPCISCGSLTRASQAYCTDCMRRSAEIEIRERLDLDAIMEREWVRRNIEQVG